MPRTEAPAYEVVRQMPGGEPPELLRTTEHPMLAASALAGPIKDIATGHLRERIAALAAGERIEVQPSGEGARATYSVKRVS